jgi:hypothetical protein
MKDRQGGKRREQSKPDIFRTWREEDVSREKDGRKSWRGSRERMDQYKQFETKTKDRKRTQEKEGRIELKANRKPKVGRTYTWPVEKIRYEGKKKGE